jgi:pimeloyl-ACP methyl ester carboxylesterase
LSVLEKEDPRDAVVVGHSYSGIVAGQVADRAPGRVSRTVFVDAFLPHDDGVPRVLLLQDRQNVADVGLEPDARDGGFAVVQPGERDGVDAMT